jgi:putative membrane protein
MSVLFGVLLLGLALALAIKWELFPLAIYAFFAGAIAALLGVRIINLGLTTYPILSGVGFVLSGACGIFSPLVVWQNDKKGLRIIGSLVLFAASAVWAWTGCMAYWAHMMVPK